MGLQQRYFFASLFDIFQEVLEKKKKQSNGSAVRKKRLCHKPDRKKEKDNGIAATVYLCLSRSSRRILQPQWQVLQQQQVLFIKGGNTHLSKRAQYLNI